MRPSAVLRKPDHLELILNGGVKRCTLVSCELEHGSLVVRHRPSLLAQRRPFLLMKFSRCIDPRIGSFELGKMKTSVRKTVKRKL